MQVSQRNDLSTFYFRNYFPKQLNPKGGGGGYLPGFEILSALIKLIT